MLKQCYLNKLDNKFAGKRNRFSSILQLTVLNGKWNNFIVSNSTADLGKDVKTIDNRYMTIQNNIKNLQKSNQLALQKIRNGYAVVCWEKFYHS